MILKNIILYKSKNNSNKFWIRASGTTTTLATTTDNALLPLVLNIRQANTPWDPVAYANGTLNSTVQEQVSVAFEPELVSNSIIDISRPNIQSSHDFSANFLAAYNSHSTRSQESVNVINNFYNQSIARGTEESSVREAYAQNINLYTPEQLNSMIAEYSGQNTLTGETVALANSQLNVFRSISSDLSNVNQPVFSGFNDNFYTGWRESINLNTINVEVSRNAIETGIFSFDSLSYLFSGFSSSLISSLISLLSQHPGAVALALMHCFILLIPRFVRGGETLLNRSIHFLSTIFMRALNRARYLRNRFTTSRIVEEENFRRQAEFGELLDSYVAQASRRGMSYLNSINNFLRARLGNFLTSGLYLVTGASITYYLLTNRPSGSSQVVINMRPVEQSSIVPSDSLQDSSQISTFADLLRFLKNVTKDFVIKKLKKL